jgi:hypothetical protein
MLLKGGVIIRKCIGATCLILTISEQNTSGDLSIKRPDGSIIILKRLFYGILVLIGVITLIFFLFNVLPAIGQDDVGQRADMASVEAIIAIWAAINR